MNQAEYDEHITEIILPYKKLKDLSIALESVLEYIDDIINEHSQASYDIQRELLLSSMRDRIKADWDAVDQKKDEMSLLLRPEDERWIWKNL